MCYTGSCPYESYPYGQNEGCICRKPRFETCYLDENDDELDPDNDGIEDEDENEISDDDLSEDINGLTPEGERNLDEFDREMFEDEDELYDD